MRRAPYRLTALVVLIVTAIALLAGCGSSDDDGSGSGTAGASAQGEKLKFVMVSHGPATDPQLAYIVNGLNRAGEDLGVDVEYRGPKVTNTNANEQRRLIESAIVTKPDGLIVTDPFPDALNATIKKATDAGIPVALANAGIGQTEATGALAVYANDERGAGVLGGEQMRRLGVEKPLVVTIPLGSLPLADDRTKGFDEGYGAPAERLEIPLNKISDQQFMKNAIEAKLAKDSEIDGVFSIGSAVSPAMLSAQSGLGSRAGEIRWGAIDVPREMLDKIEAGTVDFGIDQQLFAQPYLAAVALNLYAKYGITPASDFNATGPSLVTKDNVSRLAELEATNAG